MTIQEAATETSADKTKGVNLEKDITSYFNNKKTTYLSNWDENDLLRLKIFLEKNGISGKVEQIGNNRVNSIKEWVDIAGKKNNKVQPKTDLVIGNKKISLKYGGDTSGGNYSQGSSKALFFLCMNKNEKLNLEKEFINLLENEIGRKLPEPYTGMNQIQDTDISLYDTYHSIQLNAEKTLNDFMNNNIEIRKRMVKEMLGGQIRFNNSKASADYILKFSEKREIFLYDLNNDSTILDLSQKMKFRTRWSKNQQSMLFQMGTKMLREDFLIEISLKAFFKMTMKKIKEFLKIGIHKFLEFIGLDLNIEVSVDI